MRWHDDPRTIKLAKGCLEQQELIKVLREAYKAQNEALIALEYLVLTQKQTMTWLAKLAEVEGVPPEPAIH
jgi:hypothetical protein